VVEEIKSAGGEAVADTHSVATPEGGAAIVQTAVDAFGGVDIVINNAGILRDKAFHNMESSMWDAVIDVHLRGALNLTAPAFKIMRERGHGRIISTSSAAGLFGNFGQANYGAAKMGLVGFTRVLALEGARYDIKANAIAPIALTRMTEDLLGDLGQKLDPSTIAPVVTYLAHESCEPSGRVFSVGGGRVAEVFIAECIGMTRAGLTAEDVRDGFEQICDRTDYVVPAHIGEETKLFIDALS
jgi:NAD(P)-dependent dehydrogenase (short-subunit alcohol dehydrogenase family)